MLGLFKFLIGALFATSALANLPDSLKTAPESLSPTNEIATQAADIYWVSAGVLNKRNCPDTSCAVVGKLKSGDSASVFETKAGWARISNVEENNDEWVSLKYLTKSKPVDELNEDLSGTSVLRILILVGGFFLGWIIFPLSRSVSKNFRESPIQYFFERVGLAIAVGVMSAVFLPPFL